MVTRGVVPLSAGAGGAELVASQLAKEMVAAGHEVVLVTDVGTPPPEPLRGLSFHPLGSRSLRFVKRRLPGGFPRWLVEHLIGNVTAARAAKRLLASGGFDLVHTHGALETILIARTARVPVVYTEHDATPWICRYRHWWERAIRKLVYRTINLRACRRASHVATVFHTLGDALVARHGLDGMKVTTIVNGTDVDVFNPHRPGVNAVREVCGFERYMLFVGRLTPRKAPDLLVRAVADTPDVKLAVVGEGPMRPRLEALARELGVDDRVAFLGAVPSTDLGRIYADAEFTVLPSVSEGMPLVVIESMACGTPVLTTRLPGAESLVLDWHTGFVVKPGDLGQLEMAVRFLWGDRNLLETMGRAARETALRDYLWPQVATQYINLYESLRVAALATPDALAAIPTLLA